MVSMMYVNIPSCCKTFCLNLASIIGFETDNYVALEGEESVLVCLQVLNQINSHQTDYSISLIVLSINKTASKTYSHNVENTLLYCFLNWQLLKRTMPIR